jgi:hypothetical protein
MSPGSGAECPVSLTGWAARTCEVAVDALTPPPPAPARPSGMRCGSMDRIAHCMDDSASNGARPASGGVRAVMETSPNMDRFAGGRWRGLAAHGDGRRVSMWRYERVYVGAQARSNAVSQCRTSSKEKPVGLARFVR